MHSLILQASGDLRMQPAATGPFGYLRVRLIRPNLRGRWIFVKSYCSLPLAAATMTRLREDGQPGEGSERGGMRKGEWAIGSAG